MQLLVKSEMKDFLEWKEREKRELCRSGKEKIGEKSLLSLPLSFIDSLTS